MIELRSKLWLMHQNCHAWGPVLGTMSVSCTIWGFCFDLWCYDIISTCSHVWTFYVTYTAIGYVICKSAGMSDEGYVCLPQIWQLHLSLKVAS